MRSKGVTLVEMLIVLLIIGFLAIAASPFTSGWVKDARVAEGASALEEAIGRAKAAAMRNTARVTGDNPASLLCLSSTKTKINLIVPATSAQVLTCDLTPAWSANLSDVVTIKVENLDWICSCFNNKGLIIKPTACNTCSNKLMFQFFHTGVEREIHNFY
jgi:prepilin-type N-terminal cleavage/methylation domain-containing protein